MTRPRDFQKQRLYDWENQFRGINGVMFGYNLSVAQCSELAAQACALYDVPAVSVKDGRGRRAACYEQTTNSIKLPLWARTGWVVLHETAHAIIDNRAKATGVKLPCHGAEFVAVYVKLLAEFSHGVFTEKSLVENATGFGLQVAP